MRFLPLIAAAVLAAAIPATASAASPLGTYPNCVEPGKKLTTQSWDITDGRVGGAEKHQHSEVCFPIFSTLSAPVQIDVVTRYHNVAGETANFVRWSDGSNVKEVRSFKLVIPTNDYTRVDTFTLDPAKFDASGWREVRITSNIGTGPKGRWYTTTRWPVYVQNGKSVSNYAWNGSASSHGRCGTAGNYKSTYQNVSVDCYQLRAALAGVPITSLTWRAEWQRGVMAADADFHHGYEGQILYSGAGSNTWRTTSLAALTPGPHGLHVRTEQDLSGNVFAGVFTFPIVR